MAAAIRVLIVDDQPGVRTLLSVLLTAAGCEVSEAASADEGIARAAKFQPHAIVLDWEMPDRDGVAALPALRESAPTARIVMFTSRPGRRAAEQALAAGADDYVEKPNTAALVASVVDHSGEVIDIDAPVIDLRSPEDSSQPEEPSSRRRPP